MSLDKSIKNGRERRKAYRGSARFDRSCRPNGGCPWCERNRLVGQRRLAATIALALAETAADEQRAHPQWPFRVLTPAQMRARDQAARGARTEALLASAEALL